MDLTSIKIFSFLRFFMSTIIIESYGFGYEIKISSKAINFLCDKGFDKKYGARPLKRAIQKYIEDPVAEEIINTHLLSGDTILLDLEEGKDELSLKIKKSKPSKKTK